MMPSRLLVTAGIAGAVALATAPAAAAAPRLVVSRLDNTYSPASQTIALGETVSFSNEPRVGGGGEHNVVWDDNGVKPTPLDAVDTPWTARRTFARPGLYRYYCEEHGARNGVGMAGKVLVRNADGSLPDVSAPRLGQVSTTVARGTIAMTFTSDERGRALGKLERRVGRHFRLVGPLAFAVFKGANRVRVRKTSTRTALRPGRYRMTFTVKDAAGNRSAAKRVNVAVTG
jgi:plastocyanin